MWDAKIESTDKHYKDKTHVPIPLYDKAMLTFVGTLFAPLLFPMSLYVDWTRFTQKIEKPCTLLEYLFY